VATNDFGVPVNVDGLIGAGRRVALPVGTSVEVVERVPKPGGGELNTVYPPEAD
jgi:hypothetical protein